MRLTPFARLLGGLALVAGLSACEPTTMAPTTSPEATRAVASGPIPQSAESRSAALYYRRLEASLVSQGLMRTDGGGVDAAFGATELAHNFERVALFNEYVRQGGRFVARQSAATLRRWRDPVRVMLHFGDSAGPEMRRVDRERVAHYVQRLSRATGHSITMTTQAAQANYHVFVVSLDEQRALGPRLNAMNLGLARSTTADIAAQGRNNYCFVYASSSVNAPNTYHLAVAVIRTEHPDLMRQACYHEELAQGLGLANDSPAARPSIFNDDEEFALLTRHDELLLRMLYDRRLQPGMTPETARPIVQSLAAQLAPGRT